MRQKDNLNDVIDNGLRYLESVQQKDGSFLSLSSPLQKSFRNTYAYKTTFSTSLILLALHSLPENPSLKKIRSKASKFLLSQKSEFWSWNYWTRNSKQAKSLPYPDDLDDTFFALASLFNYNSKIIDGNVMANIVNLLTATEVKEGGPYRTWLVPENANKKWLDIDMAVNSNIAYFLYLQNIELPSLISLIESGIRNENLNSPYYPSTYPVLYFISRFYKGKKLNQVQKLLIKERGSRKIWNNPLYIALSVSSFLNLDLPQAKLKKDIAYLIKKQHKGIWKPYAFCFDPSKQGKKYYAGSSALTTAFCLEALAKFESSPTFKNKITKKDLKAEAVYKQIVSIVEKRFSIFDKDLKENALNILQEMLKKDTQREIVLLPLFFTQTLGDRKKSISNNLIKSLGAANAFGWIAYTIYDDFLDEEGDPKMLSIANVCLRELTSIFEKILPGNLEFQMLFHNVMDNLDNANAWEVTNCRIRKTRRNKNFKLPDYGNYEKLAQKSLGHALGPIAILFALGLKDNSLEIRSLLNFFKHYLIARQLNDDAHDWEKDLLMGHITPVTALVLKKVYKGKIKDAQFAGKNIKKFQKIFWYEVIEDICRLIFKNCIKARAALKKCDTVIDGAILTGLLARYENAAKQAFEEKENTIKFLRSYNS